MGSQLSIDKEFTQLDELIGLPPNSFKPCKIAVDHSHHLKMWRFCEDSSGIASKPVNLSEPQSFKSKECYLVLLIYTRDNASKFIEYPHAMWGMMETLSNLTPRGLENIFTSDDASVLDTFLLSKREMQENEAHYMLFVWNGRAAGAVLKAFTLTKGFELDKALMKGKSVMLQNLFMGAWVGGNKTTMAEVMTLDSAFQYDTSINKKPDCPVFLLQWLWPENPAPSPTTKPLFPKFRDFFLNSSESPMFVKTFEEKPVPKLNIAVKEKLDLKPKMGSLALSGLKTREQERVQLQNLSKKELDSLDENFDVRETNRKDLKLQFYNEVISELDPGLFVGSDNIARDKDKLKATGITHVINCAANVCRDYFPADFEYMHMFLKDAKSESIECIFYQCIEFIQDALKTGGKVLVHCMQGVSRSVTVCLAYIIFVHKKSFEQTFAEAKGLRGICSPNTGFQVQLIWWYKRLCESYESLPTAVRVFAIGSHSREQPHRIVARLLTQALYNPRDYKALDPRGVFIIQTISKVYMWVGGSVSRANREKYIEVALQHYERIKRFEKASSDFEQVQSGHENEEFWEIWKDSERDAIVNENWNEWYKDLDEAVDEEPQELQESDEEEVKVELKPKLFIFPETTGLGVFEDDELNETAFLCLCTPNGCFKWVGEFVKIDMEQQDRYIERVTQIYYGTAISQVIEEEPGEESFEFLNYF